MRVLYITPATFSVASAASLRNIGLSLALVEAGHEVTIASADAPGVFPDSALARFMGDNLRVVGIGVYGSKRSLTDRLAGGLSSSYARIKAVIHFERPAVIILYQSFLPMVLLLRRLADETGAAFMLDVTEWYDGASLAHGSLGPANLLNQISMRYAVPRVGCAIAISEALAAHCRRRGSSVLVVPPLFDLDFVVRSSEPREGRPIALALTGSGITPGQKDRLGLLAIASAVELIDPAAKSIRIRVTGVSRRAVETELQGPVPAAFDILGRVTWEESLAVVAESDYTVLLRDPHHRRSAFGMPSKVPESLLLGTPIFGNAVGDLNRYLSPGENSVLVGSTAFEDVRLSLEQIVAKQTRLDRQHVRAMAERDFNPQQHASALDRLLHEVRNGT